MEPIEKKRWLNTEIPLWGLILACVGMAGFLINFEFRMRTLENDSAAAKKISESVGRMAWQVDTVAKDFAEVRESVKAISTQNMDIWMLQREVSDLNCRTGGRCIDPAIRKPK